LLFYLCRTYGEPATQGRRNDLEVIRGMIKDGKGMKDIVDGAVSGCSLRTAELVLKYLEKGRDFKPEVIWVHGSTGSGKTRTAMSKYPNAWLSGKNLKWWDGYDAHSEVIIDDFRKDFCTFHELLRILDRYPYRVEVKGGSRQLLAKVIVITCPWAPKELFATRCEEDVGQLLRRIDEIICVGDAVHKVSYKFRDFEGEDPLD